MCFSFTNSYYFHQEKGTFTDDIVRKTALLVTIKLHLGKIGIEPSLIASLEIVS
jgi:hypothetical protein